MKPNFALLLSIDGIRLLERLDAGWRLLGTANPQTDDLETVLSELHTVAASYAPDGVQCALVLPGDQVRFLSVARDLETEDARETAAAALEGVTPYAVEDLAFDVTTTGDTLHIAAVARETLEEAEAFAVAHGFEPLCSYAEPDAETPDWAPFFGMTEIGVQLGVRIVPDHQPIVETPGLVFAHKPLDEPPQSEPVLFASRRSAQPDNDPSIEPAIVAPEGPQLSERETAAHELADDTIPYGADTATDEDRSHSYQKPTPVMQAPHDEAERLTVFGARDTQRIVPPRRARTGLIAASVAVLCAGAGGWLALGLGTNDSVPDAPLPVAQIEAPEPSFIAPDATSLSDTPATDIATVAPKTLPARATPFAEEAVATEALQPSPLPEPDLTKIAPAPVENERAQYAVTGIWVTPPDVPVPADQIDVDALYVPSIDPVKLSFDAVALPDVTAQPTDVSLPTPASPAPAGTTFTLNEKGLVAPSSDGTLNPDGVPVFSGPPPAEPPERPASEETVVDTRFAAVAGIRPIPRPDDLIETNERAQFSGLTRSELADLRPRARPRSAQEDALAAASLVPLGEDSASAALTQDGSIVSATARAIPQSRRPDARPSNFDKIVANSKPLVTPKPAAAPVRTASVAPRSVTPSIPSSASVTREATIQNAINLRKINLIGVYGKPSDRRALVRLANGRYKKVQVGDRIDGGRISAIGDAELRYQKSGRNVVLKMPRG